MIDVNKLIRQYLTADGTEVEAVVGDNVYLQRLPSTHDEGDGAVVFFVNGGDGIDFDMDIIRVRVMFRCYGVETDEADIVPQDSMVVYRALNDRLHGVNMQTVSEGVLLTGEEVIPGQVEVDPDTAEEYVMCAYDIECHAAS